MEIPFNRPHTVGTEFGYISDAIERGQLSGNGTYAKRCTDLLSEMTGAARVLLTPSCTAALEMMALLTEVGADDEVIVPSFTFVTSANAFALRGATPVFVDVRPDTLNLDERQVEAAITPRTKAIVAVHYAGVGCDMEVLQDIADRHGIALLEDAAQGILSTHGTGSDARPLGSFGALGALSFHETKNVHCGEGGALLINDEAFAERAEIIQEKGTNRSRFFRGQVDKYTWVDLGSSYLLSEINAAFLWAQLRHADEITRRRLEIWDRYHEAFADLEAEGLVRRPVVPSDATHNAHMYYLLLDDVERRDATIRFLGERGVRAVFHYVPLHEAPAGTRFGRAHGELPVTLEVSSRLLRLPLWPDLSEAELDHVIESTRSAVHAPTLVR